MAAGGGGGAAESPYSRAETYARFNPNASRDEVMSVAQGMTPLQYANFNNARTLMQGTNKAPGAFADVRKYAREMRNLASGGLMNDGLRQLRTSLAAPPNAGLMQTQMAGRYGMAATPEQQAYLNQQNQMAQTSAQVALANQTRAGLGEVQRGMRFGGIQL